MLFLHNPLLPYLMTKPPLLADITWSPMIEALVMAVSPRVNPGVSGLQL